MPSCPRPAPILAFATAVALAAGAAHAAPPSETLAAAGLAQPDYDSVLGHYLAGRTELLEDADFVREFGKYALCEDAAAMAEMNQFERRRAEAEAEGKARAALEAAVAVKPEPLRIGIAYFGRQAQQIGEYDFDNEFFPLSWVQPGAMPQLQVSMPDDTPRACRPNHPELQSRITVRFRGADLLQRLEIPLDEAEAVFNAVGETPLGLVIGAEIAGNAALNPVDQFLSAGNPDAPEPATVDRGAQRGPAVDAIVNLMSIRPLAEIVSGRQRFLADFGAPVREYDRAWFVERYGEIRAQDRATLAAIEAFRAADLPSFNTASPAGGPYSVPLGQTYASRGALDARDNLRSTGRRLGFETARPLDAYVAPFDALPEALPDLSATGTRMSLLGIVEVSDGAPQLYCQAEGGTVIGGGGASGIFGSGSSSAQAAEYEPVVSVVEGGTGVMNARLRGTFGRMELFALTAMASPTSVRICPYKQALSSAELVRLNMQGIDIMAQDICRDFTVASEADWETGVTQAMDFPSGDTGGIRGAEVTCRRGGADAPARTIGKNVLLDYVLVQIDSRSLATSINDPSVPGTRFVTLPLEAGADLPWVTQ